jgi:sugar phosphate isomerase/epimerase
MNTVFINTLVFRRREKAYINQAYLMHELVSACFKDIEVRREFMHDIEHEILEIGKVVSEHNINLYYSIADTLFDDNKINEAKITSFFNEAKSMGSKTVKLSVGDFSSIDEKSEVFLKKITSGEIKLFVENDQTIENGTIEKILKFLKEAKSKNIDIKATFDIGNWVWTGEDSKENAIALKEFVEYVHFKDVLIVEGKLTATTLGNGDVDYNYFKNLFEGKDFGIEYPCGEYPIDVIKEEVKKLY